MWQLVVLAANDVEVAAECAFFSIHSARIWAVDVDKSRASMAALLLSYRNAAVAVAVVLPL